MEQEEGSCIHRRKDRSKNKTGNLREQTKNGERSCYGIVSVMFLARVIVLACILVLAIYPCYGVNPCYVVSQGYSAVCKPLLW